MKFAVIDYIVFAIYAFTVIGIGLWVSREPKGKKKNASDYFLASKALPWWVIGASLIAANISAEQFIGMSGSGFKIGLGIASYEWMAALTLILIAIFFVPIYLKKGIFTMPQFLEQRFDKRVKVVMAIFWLAVFIFINLTSILYLGALAVHNMMGISLFWSIILLALFAMVYSVYGGLKAVALTDVIQVFFLILGGIIVTVVATSTLGEGSFLTGLKSLFNDAPEKFDMVLDKSHPSYNDLPGLGVILGGMWVANLYYWGCNQYIIQRVLAAKSIPEAQKGILFAGFLKLLIPLIVVVPGIIAFLLHQKGMIVVEKPDHAYPILLTLIPSGIRGIAFAALVAAILSSLASMMNSISTIFTMDIYPVIVKREIPESKKVTIGRITAVISMLIAIMVAPLLTRLDQAFQYIQEFTGFISPGALTIFLTGFFYKKATPNGALAAALGTFIYSLAFKLGLPDIPFLDRMGYVFLLCLLTIWIFAKIENKSDPDKVVKIEPGMFKTTSQFKWGAALIIIILIILYAIWW